MTVERREVRFVTTPIGRHGDHELTLPPPWVGRALCAQVAPELFFPKKGESTRDAKSICGQCEVRVECLDAALTRETTEYAYGIYGGLTGAERKRLLKQNKNTQPNPEGS